MNFGSFKSGPQMQFPDGIKPLNLEKGEILDLTKQAPSLKNVVFAAKWDINDSGKDNYDLDLSAFLLDRNGRITNPETQVVYFLQLAQQGIFLEGDNLTGGNEDGDDERINISLPDIAPEIHQIVFIVTIYDAPKKRQTFGMVKNSYVRLLDADQNERELCRFELKENASSATAVTFAKLVRNPHGGWSFETIGDASVVHDLNQLLLRYIKA